MAAAGFCAKCGENVWLDSNGACMRGHEPECVSAVYEAARPDACGSDDDAVRTSNRRLFGIAAVVLLLPLAIGVLFLLAGIVVGLLIPLH